MAKQVFVINPALALGDGCRDPVNFAEILELASDSAAGNLKNAMGETK